MRNVIKTAALILTAALIAPAFSACTGTPAGGSDSEPATTVAVTTDSLITAVEDITTGAETSSPAETTEAEKRQPSVIVPDEIMSAVLYYTNGQRMANVTNGKVYKYVYVEGREYYLTSSLTAQDPGFPLVIYFNSSDKMIGTQFVNTPSMKISAEQDKLNVPAGTAYIYVNARGVDAVMHDYSDKVQTEPVTEAPVTPEDDPFFIAPDEILPAVLYYTNGKRMANVSNGKVFKYNYKADKEYYLTSSLTAQDAGFPLVIYFDATDKIIGTQFVNTPGKRIEAVDDKLNVPAGTSYIYVNARGVDAVMVSALDIPAKPAETKDVSILFVGNSLTQDAVAYLPYVLVHSFPEINFKFYMWYCGGFDLGKTYDYFVNNTPCEIFSVSENKQSWTNSAKTMSDILASYTFDIVCLQEYFNYKPSFAEADLTAWNGCRDFITANYKGGNALKFISLFHAPKRDSAESIYGVTESGNRLILEKTVAEDIVAPGIAVKLAMDTDLKKLGDKGNLSPDGTHTQEGLPCLLQTYVMVLWLLDRLGINKDLSAVDVTVTSQVYSKINVPGANLGSGVVTGSKADNELAKEVAVSAFKTAGELYPALKK